MNKKGNKEKKRNKHGFFFLQKGIATQAWNGHFLLKTKQEECGQTINAYKDYSGRGCMKNINEKLTPFYSLPSLYLYHSILYIKHNDMPHNLGCLDRRVEVTYCSLNTATEAYSIYAVI